MGAATGLTRTWSLGAMAVAPADKHWREAIAISVSDWNSALAELRPWLLSSSFRAVRHLSESESNCVGSRSSSGSCLPGET